MKHSEHYEIQRRIVLRAWFLHRKYVFCKDTNIHDTCQIFPIKTALCCLSVQVWKTTQWTELSKANNVYITKFSIETRLEYGFCMENTYFQ